MAKQNNKLYVLWDESHLWGIMLIRALREMRFPFAVIDAQEISRGLLSASPPAGLIVPGGWARLKARKLGRRGMAAIKTYVKEGGTYLGFCGGAGLALKSTSGLQCLDLCPWGRKPMSNRLPNFSGHVLCRVKPDITCLEHRKELLLPVWWPSQFEPLPNGSDVQVLAAYAAPGPDFWSSDLDFSQMDMLDIPRWESIYGINLNPKLLTGEPCLIKGLFGQGTYILSYSHLETPESPEANLLLAALLNELLGKDIGIGSQQAPCLSWDLKNFAPAWKNKALSEAKASMDQIIAAGKRQFLLLWRNNWLLGWRRGVPGSPINFLYAMICQALSEPLNHKAASYWNEHQHAFSQDISKFMFEIKFYLSHERLALTTAPSSPEISSDQDLQEEKTRIFGTFPGYGGMYGRLIQNLDQLIYLNFQEDSSR